jgi:hypothetical protein
VPGAAPGSGSRQGSVSGLTGGGMSSVAVQLRLDDCQRLLFYLGGGRGEEVENTHAWSSNP